MLNLSLLNPKTAKGTIFVYDRLGKICKKQEISLQNGTQYSLSIIDLPEGIYILTLQAGADIFAKRFIVE